MSGLAAVLTWIARELGQARVTLTAFHSYGAVAWRRPWRVVELPWRPGLASWTGCPTPPITTPQREAAGPHGDEATRLSPTEATWRQRARSAAAGVHRRTR